MPEFKIEKPDTYPILDEHQHINSRKARSNFSRLVKSARFEKARVVITEHGEPAAAIISVEDLLSLDEVPELSWLDDITEMEFRDLSLNELRARLGRDAPNSATPDERQRDEDNGEHHYVHRSKQPSR